MKVGALTAPNRPTITTAVAGALTMPTGTIPTMYFLGGVTNASVSINDGEQEYYLLGNGGFADSVKVTTRAQASITSYFQKDLDSSGLDETAYDEAMDIVLRGRNDRDFELYTEIYKHNGATTYDVTVFVASVMNYSESYPADNLVEVTFDLMSRGPVGVGRATVPGTIIPGIEGNPNE
ncbi:MAG: hypothetical protein CBC03_01285 [Pseudoalteromonas sp. TMED43]|nr:MAG: hypothetical protein CBC03_01285 [Pseudoalteromonas sp. TMED43]